MTQLSAGDPEPAEARLRSDHDRIRAMLLPALADTGVTSMDRFSTDLMSALRKQPDISVELASTGRGPGFGAYLPRRLTRGGTRFVWYPAAARRLHGDVFHVLDQGYAHLVGVVDPRRTIVTCHDLIPLRASATGASFQVPRSTLAWYRIAVGFLRRAAHVACVSETTRKDVIALLGVDPARTSVVVSGVDERFRQLPSERRHQVRSGFPTRAMLLLHVSSGAPYKNVAATLATLAELRRRGHEALLLRVGPPLSQGQSKVAECHGVSRYVVEHGAVADEALVELYGAADVVMVPSYWEGFGWPVVEALACGTPTVISNCEPLLETAADAALSAPAESAAAIATAVERFWTSPELREEFRLRGLERVRSLSWERTAREYVTLYRSVASPSGGGVRP